MVWLRKLWATKIQWIHVSIFLKTAFHKTRQIFRQFTFMLCSSFLNIFISYCSCLRIVNIKVINEPFFTGRPARRKTRQIFWPKICAWLKRKWATHFHSLYAFHTGSFVRHRHRRKCHTSPSTSEWRRMIKQRELSFQMKVEKFKV